MAEKTKNKEESQRQRAETVDLGSHYERLHAGIISSHDSVSDRGQRGPIDQYFPGVEGTLGGTYFDSRVTRATRTEIEQAARLDIARYFYKNCIPFHTARSPSFIGMCRTLGNYSRGLRLPTPHGLRPLHAATCMLNPRYNYDSTWQLPLRMRNVIYDTMDRLVPNVDDQRIVDVQLGEFRAKRGIFGRDVTKATTMKHAPAEWWDAYGNDTPELKAFAIKVLSLICSSSACERNWSTFNKIHTKRRNRLSVEKMNQLAYVMYNRKLRERHMNKLGLKDDEELPVNLDEYPTDEEWIGADDEEVPVNRASRSGLHGGEAIEGSEGAHGGEARKRKTTPIGVSRKEKGKCVMRPIEESETKEEDDEGAIQYAETSGSDDDDGIDGGDGSYDPNFQLPASDASMFH